MLPGPAYVRAFVRDYAEQLGLDPQALMAELSTHPDLAEEPVMIAPRPVATVPLLSRRTRSAAWTLALVVAAGGRGRGARSSSCGSPPPSGHLGLSPCDAPTGPTACWSWPTCSGA